jgi:hypothetical protein
MDPGGRLPAIPNAGTDLNAYYDRKALNFFRRRTPRRAGSSIGRAPTW